MRKLPFLSVTLVVAFLSGRDACTQQAQTQPSTSPRFTTTLEFAFNNSANFVPADIDADGDVDFVSGGGPVRGGQNYFATVRRNQGNGVFGLEPIPAPPGVNALLDDNAADVDGDGDVDFVCGGVFMPWTGTGRRSFVLINDGAGILSIDQTRFAEKLLSRSRVELADFDGDGDVDAFFCGSRWVPFGTSWALQPDWDLWLNDGHGYFTDVTATHLPALTPSPGAGRYHTSASGDLNGDGFADLIIAEWIGDGTGLKHVLMNDRSGHFVHTTSFAPPRWNWGALRLADVDGDTDLDLLVCSDGPNGLFINDGRGNFLDASAQLPPLNFTVDARFADFDQDGDLDLVVNSLVAGAVAGPSILLNDGNGVFAPVAGAFEFSPLPGGCDRLTVADVDGDRDVDIMVAWPTRSLWSTGALFVNLHRHQMGPSYTPRGAPYTVKVDGQAHHAMVVGLTTRPGSLSLGPLGRWGLDLASTVWLPPVVLPLTRTANLSLPIPGHPSLQGVPLYTQAIDVDLTVPAPVHVTNWWKAVIQ